LASKFTVAFPVVAISSPPRSFTLFYLLARFRLNTDKP